MRERERERERKKKKKVGGRNSTVVVFFQPPQKKKPHLGEDGEREGVGHAPVGSAVSHAVDEALTVPVEVEEKRVFY